ncbi:hypothetical protein [Pseudomonas sp. DG56-2]|uniref:hypothetical protein n=1 Tax=Pseudomonas sp. DG56-2 TaxID=2320270 RepID=UPI0010A5C036|nr:hypothetical protein [Pseudomonas sp. DG56-2]
MDSNSCSNLASWYRLLEVPGIEMNCVEQYEELMKMADKLQRQGVITTEERNALILQATAHYASVVERPGEQCSPSL